MLRVVLRVLVALVACLPWSWLGRGGAVVGALAASVLRVRRSAVDAAMVRANVPPVARAMYASLGTGLLELLWLAGASAARRRRVLREEVILDPALDLAFHDACARGPVVLAASHTANWELVAYGAAHVLAARGVRLAVVAKPLAVTAFDAFCTELRTAAGLVLIAPAGALGRAREHLAAGGVVAVPIDQVPERARHGTRVTFLGVSALADRAPAALARAAGATLLVVGATRDGRRQRVHLLEALTAPPKGVDRGWTVRATVRATEALDSFVCGAPATWMWLHRRWRAPLERQARAARLVATGHPG
jgi:KDO2-lipid IV(A) lauroyltransferase